MPAQQQQQRDFLEDQRHSSHPRHNEQEQQQRTQRSDHRHFNHDHQVHRDRHGTFPLSASATTNPTKATTTSVMAATVASPRQLVVEVEAHLHSAVGDWGDCSPDTCTQSRPVVCETRDSKIVPNHLCGEQLPEAVRACTVADDANACSPPSAAAKAESDRVAASETTPAENRQGDKKGDENEPSADEVAKGESGEKGIEGGVSNGQGRGGGGYAASAKAQPPTLTVDKDSGSSGKGGYVGSSTTRSKGGETGTERGGTEAATSKVKPSTPAEEDALRKTYRRGDKVGTPPTEGMKAGEEEGGEALSKDGDGETEEAGGRQGEGGASGSGGVRGADKGVVSSPSVVPKELTTPRQVGGSFFFLLLFYFTSSRVFLSWLRVGR